MCVSRCNSCRRIGHKHISDPWLFTAILFVHYSLSSAIPTDASIDSPTPAPIWLWQKPVKKTQGTTVVEWVAFHVKDQEILEAAWNEGAESCVLLAGKKWEACVIQRECRPVFWDGEGLKMMRAVWFLRRWTVESLFDPIPESESESIEAWVKKGSVTPLTVSIYAEKDYGVSIRHLPGKGSEVVATYKGFMGEVYGHTQLKKGPIRGQFEAPPMPPGTDLPARHLVLAVHGIGEAFFETIEGVQNWVDQIAAFEQLTVTVDAKTGTQKPTDHPRASDQKQLPERPSKVEVLPIRWHRVVHDKKHGLDQRLKKITLTTVKGMREMANNLLGDVVYYSAARYQKRILESVSKQMNEVVQKWRQVHGMREDECLNVSILGHSLGSVIVYDLAMAQEGKLPAEGIQGNFTLDFAFQNLFLLGSPVGFFLTSRDLVEWHECGSGKGSSPVLPKTVRTYNVMQANDPVAYRIEPLVLPDVVPDEEDEEATEPDLTASKGTDTTAEQNVNGRKKTKGRIPAAFVPYISTEGVAPHVAARVAMEALTSVPAELFAGNTQRAKAVINGAVEAVAGVTMDEEEKVRKDAVLKRLLEINPSGERLDWVLQESASRTLMAEYINAVESHMKYFDQEDLARFIVTKCDRGALLLVQEAA